MPRKTLHERVPDGPVDGDPYSITLVEGLAVGTGQIRTADLTLRKRSSDLLLSRTTAFARALFERPPVSSPGGMVGTGRFELPTCRLGGGRSIHLSYVPN